MIPPKVPEIVKVQEDLEADVGNYGITKKYTVYPKTLRNPNICPKSPRDREGSRGFGGRCWKLWCFQKNTVYAPERFATPTYSPKVPGIVKVQEDLEADVGSYGITKKIQCMPQNASQPQHIPQKSQGS